MATVSGCPGTVDPGASDALPSDAGILQGGAGESSPHAPVEEEVTSADATV